jgi:putative lipoprotein
VKGPLFLALSLALLAVARPARAESDDWFGRDKWLHFGVSAGLAGGGYAASTLALEERWQRAAAGASLALTLGAAKELYDLSGAGDASWRDLSWDVAGTIVGVGLAWLLDLAVSEDEPSATRSSAMSSAPLTVSW